MKITIRKERKAVAPVIATLLMIAVAVAMSVIIFMWSQGFLSNTSNATGGQQGAQNQAAQSPISVESATFVAWSSTASTTATIVIRDVGAVGVTIGTVTISGGSANTGLTQPITFTVPATGGGTVNVVAKTTTGISALTDVDAAIGKGNALTLTITFTTGTTTGYKLASGDTINVKATTNVGTFSQISYTVP